MGSKRLKTVCRDSNITIEVTECKEDSLAIKIVKVLFKDMCYWRILKGILHVVLSVNECQ